MFQNQFSNIEEEQKDSIMKAMGMFFLQFSERENKLQQSLHEVNKLYQYLLILEKNIKFYKIVTNEVVGMKREHLEFEENIMDICSGHSRQIHYIKRELEALKQQVKQIPTLASEFTQKMLKIHQVIIKELKDSQKGFHDKLNQLWSEKNDLFARVKKAENKAAQSEEKMKSLENTIQELSLKNVELKNENSNQFKLLCEKELILYQIPNLIKQCEETEIHLLDLKNIKNELNLMKKSLPISLQQIKEEMLEKMKLSLRKYNLNTNLNQLTQKYEVEILSLKNIIREKEKENAILTLELSSAINRTGILQEVNNQLEREELKFNEKWKEREETLKTKYEFKISELTNENDFIQKRLKDIEQKLKEKEKNLEASEKERVQLKILKKESETKIKELQEKIHLDQKENENLQKTLNEKLLEIAQLHLQLGDAKKEKKKSFQVSILEPVDSKKVSKLEKEIEIQKGIVKNREKLLKEYVEEVYTLEKENHNLREQLIHIVLSKQSREKGRINSEIIPQGSGATSFQISPFYSEYKRAEHKQSIHEEKTINFDNLMELESELLFPSFEDK